MDRAIHRDTTDLLALQDDIAAQAAARIDPEILLLEARRARTGLPRKPPPTSSCCVPWR